MKPETAQAHFFQLFGPAHGIALAVIFSLAAGLVLLARHPRTRAWMPWINKILICGLLGNAAFWGIGAVSRGVWLLPLQICDLVIFAAAYSFWKHRQWVWELAYFWTLGGTVQAVLTPDISFTFPHFLFFKFFVTHGLTIIAVFYLSAGCGRPIFHASVWRVFLITNVYTLAVGIVNGILGTNYLYLCAKPSHPSLMDHLGPWPWYILGLEGIFIASLYFYYFPYWIAGKRTKNLTMQN